MVCMQRMRGRGLCALAAAWIAVTVPVRGDILLVHHDPPATGFWSTAVTLDTALAAAQPGDQIWIAGGTYVPQYTAPTGNPPPTSPARQRTYFVKVDGTLEIAGNFAGTETQIGQRDHINPAHETILSGLIGSNPNDWNDRATWNCRPERSSAPATSTPTRCSWTGRRAISG